MKERILKAALVCAGLVISLSACGQSEERKESASDVNLKTGNIENENKEIENVDSDNMEIDNTETASLDMSGTEDISAETSEPEESEWYQQMLEASILSAGTNGRLEKVLEKMKNGESVSTAFIGGSVTEGALAASYEESYADCFAAKLQEKYQDARYRVSGVCDQ